MSKPICWIIAGPNGAGKTTFALNYLPNVVGCRHFVNADLIAAGLAPLAPEQQLAAASRLFLHEMSRLIKQRVSFAFETTLSGLGHLRRVKRLMAEGWRVELIYLALPDVEMSLSRVAERVSHGGHDVPEVVIRRRFPRCLNNLLNHYSPVVSHTHCYINSGSQPVLVFRQQKDNRNILRHNEYEILIHGVSL